jgi:hypothetical protein
MITVRGPQSQRKSSFADAPLCQVERKQRKQSSSCPRQPRPRVLAGVVRSGHRPRPPRSGVVAVQDHRDSASGDGLRTPPRNWLRTPPRNTCEESFGAGLEPELTLIRNKVCVPLYQLDVLLANTSRSQTSGVSQHTACTRAEAPRNSQARAILCRYNGLSHIARDITPTLPCPARHACTYHLQISTYRRRCTQAARTAPHRTCAGRWLMVAAHSKRGAAVANGHIATATVYVSTTNTTHRAHIHGAAPRVVVRTCCPSRPPRTSPSEDPAFT